MELCGSECTHTHRAQNHLVDTATEKWFKTHEIQYAYPYINIQSETCEMAHPVKMLACYVSLTA